MGGEAQSSAHNPLPLLFFLSIPEGEPASQPPPNPMPDPNPEGPGFSRDNKPRVADAHLSAEEPGPS
jgi:hypothetical protein